MIVLTLTSLLFVLFVIKWIKRPQSPPGPIGLPIVGYYPFLGENPFVTIQKLAEKHGDIMKINLLNEDFYFLNSLESIKEAFVKKGENFSDRPNDKFYVLRHTYTDYALDNAEGETWKVLRNFMLKKLSEFGMGKSEFEMRIHEVCDVTVKNIQNENSKAFDPYDYLANFASNVISSIAYSKYYAYNDPKYVELKKISFLLIQAVEYCDGILTGPLFYLFKRIKRTSYNLGIEGRNRIHDYMYRELKERIDAGENDEYNDMLNCFLKEMNEKNSKFFNNNTLIWNFVALFHDGTETVAMTLYFAIILLTIHPEIQKRVQQEIDEQLGRDRMVSTQDRNLFNYTNAVIAEIERFSFVTPLGMVRVNKREDTVGDYVIPKRSNVIANIWKISRDKRFFKNPENFDPQNFLDKEGRFVNNEANLIFSIGTRKCLAAKLAETELFICLVRLMQKFEWKPTRNEDLNFNVNEGAVRICVPYKIHAMPRL